MYTKQLSFNRDEAEELLEIAKDFEMEEVEEAVSEYLENKK